MPRQDIRKSVIMSAWTQQEQIDEIRGKLHLKERDARAFYESSQERKIKYEKMISKLRAENSRTRVDLASSINGDEKVIRSVFQDRKEELLSMQRFTVDGAIKTMDQKVCEASKRLNAIKYDADQKTDRLKELQDSLRQMRIVDTRDIDLQRQQTIRRLQNEMDKAGIKYEAARNITRRYEEIMMHMQEECRLYPSRLDALEGIYRDATAELDELTVMNEKAVKSSEEQRRDLMTMEREMYQAKRARDQQLNETRKEVERRKEPDRAERRAKVTIVPDTNDSKALKLLQEKEDRQEKILTLEDAFEKIKSAIYVSNINDIVFRVTNQDNTRTRILLQEEEKLLLKEKLKEREQDLKAVFEELKFTSQRQIAKGRKVIDEMQDYVHKEEAARELCQSQLSTNEKLLLDLQSGIATLYEKLSEIRLKPPYHNFSRNDPVEDLANCYKKLEVLLTSLGAWPKGAVESVVPVKINNYQLQEYLEGKLPADNMRIKVDADDGSDIDDFHFDHDQDNEGLLSRDDIKRQGTEFLNSRLRPKKKKGRKVRMK